MHEIPRPPLSSGRCRRWNDLVHTPFISNSLTRADRDWDWRWQIPLLAFAGGLIRRPRIFQLCRADDDFPLAMIALLEDERWVFDQSQTAVYLWYLTGAPKEAFSEKDAPKLLTAAALDVAITISLEGAAQGRLWLHAAPEGGTALTTWYYNCGLKRVPLRIDPLPGSKIAKRVNDGRYFFLNRESSELVSNSMKAYRG